VSYEIFDYEKIQNSLASKGWNGDVSDIQSIIKVAHNESTVLFFIRTLKNLILKPCFDECKPNFYNTPDRVELFENIEKTIRYCYIEPCMVESFESELYDDITIVTEDFNFTFSIQCSDSLIITKSFKPFTSSPEKFAFNFSK
jgi:hypothetical protein